jgi:hypothetical protein
MKKCSQCGTIVSESSKTGDRCPRCGLTWQAERNVPFSAASKSKKNGCFLSLILLFIIIIIPAFLLTFSDHRLSYNSNQISSLWITLNNDSLSISLKKISSLSPEKRDKIINKASKDYINLINTTKGEDKIRIISFISCIDSSLKTNGLPIPFALTNKLIEIESDNDLMPQIHESAANTLNRIKKDTY